jgi:hypothetical protein
MGGCIESARTSTISKLSLVNEDAMKQISRAVKMNHGYLINHFEDALK